MRKELKLKEGKRVRVSLAGDRSIAARPAEDPESFAALEGVIKEGGPVEGVDPSD